MVLRLDSYGPGSVWFGLDSITRLLSHVTRLLLILIIYFNALNATVIVLSPKLTKVIIYFCGLCII